MSQQEQWGSSTVESWADFRGGQYRAWSHTDGSGYGIEWTEGNAEADIVQVIGTSPTSRGPRRIVEVVDTVPMDREAQETGVLRLPMMLDAWRQEQEGDE